MNVVDSSGWLEYFAGTERADLFAPAIERTERLIVPVISIFEVFRKLFREFGENAGLQAYAVMSQGRVVDLDERLVLRAAPYPLPMADSIILATAQEYRAIVWTQDRHFQGLPQVKFFE